MDFAYPEHHELMRDAIKGVCAPFGPDYWLEKDRAHEHPTELWKALGDNGWLGTSIPEEHGGQGLGFLDQVFVIEEACKAGGGCTLSQLFMTTPVFGGETIRLHGAEWMKEKLLPQIAAGEIDFCMALTEPDAGSDTFATTTTARRDGDEWVINGQKVWITAVPQSTYTLLIARTKGADEVDRKWKGLSLFLVPTGTKGITHAPLPKVGTCTLPSSTMWFDDVRIPLDHLVGVEDMGWKHLTDTLNTERLVTAAGCLATADLCLEIASNYASERVVFGRAIGSNQGVQFPLAEIKMQVEAARVLTYKAAWAFDNGDRGGSDANMAKYLAAEAGWAAADRAMQTLGGYGFSQEYHVERLWRDVRLFRLAPLAQELILGFVGQHVLGMPKTY